MEIAHALHDVVFTFFEPSNDGVKGYELATSASSALPVIHYVAMKVQEVNDLRFIVRGRLAGLSNEVIEAHIL